ncbi:phosphomevalonate kinase [Kwoniella shandongensis]|uniref:Phosphomevalonate kinase n=1 Tax=Kwoniella shandongensis TaxID=1734106 RepID=A0A5M6BT31_9TREE|nr:phosphomevalonate kinase [Kwoniella shandongensis]KAA5525341.1 phosphomevalonate kinase [Kwoniella shandongensis]
MPRQTIISSPGKVLLAGGYLVLDRQFSGLVVATSSRFYSCVTDLPPSDEISSTNRATISVRAGQFPSTSSTWVYTLTLSGEELVLEQTNEAEVGKNKFIAISLLKTLELAYEKIEQEQGGDGVKAGEELLRRVKGETGGQGLEVVVLADNDFYSQREQLAALSLPPRLSSLPSLQPFTQLPRPIPQTNKTGLGSSAALVTSLVTSLLSHLSIISLPSSSTSSGSPSTDLLLVHSLAQYAHCLAQGKVGSGFDISSAVFGTHIYRRFSRSVLTPLMDKPPTSTISLSSSTATSKALPWLDPSEWDGSTTPFRLPKGLRLILADVDAGTDTPSFVGKVLEWRKREAEKATEVWKGLDKANMQLEKLLSGLVEREGDADYDATLRWAAERKFEGHAESETADLLIEVRATLLVIREYLREMSELSGVPIEPPEQTRLLDASSDVPGVLGGGVPGAGGYDAIFLLTIDSPDVISAVDDLWSSWTEMSVCPLLAKQSDGGLRIESLEDVKGLKEALTRV